MKFILPLLLLSTPFAARAADTLLPAGSLVQCTVSEPRLSSQTAQIGDPVLCQVSHVELYGRAVIPYGSYMVGHFEDYKDPGHLVGKGWVELKFDRLVVGDTVVPLQARVVAVPKYNVDKEGKIHGNGHPVKDTVEWLIPVLWPLDLINLPRRGPRVVLKPETRLTLKVMDDVGLPVRDEPARQPALISRAAEPAPQYAPAPVERNYAPQSYAPQPTYAPQYAPQQYASAPQTVIYQYAPPPPQQVIVQQAPPPVVVQQYAPAIAYRYPPPPPYGYARYYPY